MRVFGASLFAFDANNNFSMQVFADERSSDPSKPTSLARHVFKANPGGADGEQAVRGVDNRHREPAAPEEQVPLEEAKPSDGE